MAKRCKIIKEKKRMLMSKKAYVAREALREIVKSPFVSYEEKMAAVRKLNTSDRNKSAIRVRQRCRICGRPRGVYRKFGLCRIHLREAFVRGDVPGLVKASW